MEDRKLGEDVRNAGRERNERGAWYGFRKQCVSSMVVGFCFSLVSNRSIDGETDGTTVSNVYEHVGG